jgi:hypothetical protein
VAYSEVAWRRSMSVRAVTVFFLVARRSEFVSMAGFSGGHQNISI